jgi:ABC-type antimicrobial peptide transport system permease subunit
MTFRTLIVRSLRFHWRAHLGVLLGAAVGSAALTGALVVGDSVRLSLRDLALQRLGNVHFLMDVGDRNFRSGIAELTESAISGRIRRQGDNRFPPNATGVIRTPVIVSNRFAKFTTTNAITVQFGSGGPTISLFSNSTVHVSSVLKLDATAAASGGRARANRVQLFGVDDRFGPMFGTAVYSNLPTDRVLLNQSLASQLNVKAGDIITIRSRKPDALGSDSPLAPQDDTAVVLRLRVHHVLSAAEGGNFNLTASQPSPFNAFVALSTLQEKSGVLSRANLLISGAVQRAVQEPPKFSWVQWAGDRLRRTGSRLIPPPPLFRTDTLSDAEGLPVLNRGVGRVLSLSDLQLHLPAVGSRNEIELRSSRVFLDSQVVEAVLSVDRSERLFSTRPYGVLTYMVNLLRSGARVTPYSMVTAAGPPLLPMELKDDEILINQWLADDLGVQKGSEIDLVWFVPDLAARLVEATNRFRVREVLPMDHPTLDRTLMPDFPGVANAEKAGDWETGFPLVHEIREKDDKYWHDYRGTPKAFVSLAAGQRMWSSRQGNLTAIRFPTPPGQSDSAWSLSQMEVEASLRRILTADREDRAEGSPGPIVAPASSFDPASLGFRFAEVRAKALAGANQAQDFGGLFIGFSFFLILAALILMALLFQFGIEQRTNEVGTLLALGFTPKSVRNLLLGEGVAVAFVGGVLGVLGGIGYAKAMLFGLTTLWRDAVGTSALHFHATPLTLVIGLFASVVVCAVTIWIVLRKQAQRPARELLAEGAGENVQGPRSMVRGRPARWIALGAGVAALAMIGWAIFGGDGASPELFFGAGALLLVAEMAAVAVLLSALDRSEASSQPTLSAMGLRNATRRRTRSLASVALLACGSFLVASIGANRLDAGRDAMKRSSGTGGFALFGEATLPVVRDLNTQAGREFFGLDEKAMKDVSVVGFRVRDGDDASCLNLNRAQTPRLLGVWPEDLAHRKAFTFAKVASGYDVNEGWELLRYDGYGGPGSIRSPSLSDGAIPAIGDAASIQWALGKKLGDTIEYTDERGQKFKVRLVAGVANSILQGNLIIDEAEFVKRFPSEAGHRMFLIDVPSNTGAESNRLEKASAAMSRALQDVGLELTPTTQRLAAFNAVQNTYLNTFQVLGGLGLLLGSAGLGVVVLRNVLERRGELGLLQAVGFRRRSLHWLVLSEHGGLLGLGLAVGITAAVAAVLPALLAPGAETHYVALVATLAGVFASGLAWTWVATRLALRGELLKALRNE